MKTKIVTACFVIGTLLAAPIAIHAADSNVSADSTGTIVNDSVITGKVKAKLAGEKMSSLMNISVNTDRTGVVVLSGKVKTQEEVDKAVSIARGTEGVTSVKSDIQVSKD
ncbi:hyperosmotically inducible periplasmic protein [Gammaproteobacteria bacterium]